MSRVKERSADEATLDETNYYDGGMIDLYSKGTLFTPEVSST